jgi:Putative rhamnosyl transferase
VLVLTRFGIGIRDPSWFEHRLTVLAAITQPSLLGQTSQDFDWAILVSSELPDAVRSRLEELLLPFEGRAYLCYHRQAYDLQQRIEARDLIDRDGYLLAGRVDDDDAWRRSTIEEVHMRVATWRANRGGAEGYGLTFESGLVWLMYDMHDLDQLERRGLEVIRKAAIRRYTHPFTSISSYVYARPLEALETVRISHARAEKTMTERNYTVDRIQTNEPMWLYCRHKQTDSPIERGEGPDLGFTIPELGNLFGIDPSLTRQYIAEQDSYGYGRVLRKFTRRGQILQELREINARLDAGVTTERQAELFVSRQAELKSELAMLSERVTIEPGELPAWASNP